ncbi:hypothetical protein Ocin01_18780, partial [Orchesella cincta]
MADDDEVEVKVKPETGPSKKADEGATKKVPESRLFVHVPLPGTLELHSGNVSANWKRWFLKWTMYELATGLDTKSGRVRIAAMLSSVGQDGLDLFQTFEWKDENEPKSYRAVMEKFEKWCTPRGNTMFRDVQIMQGESEKIDSYVAALKLQASNCGFGADDMARRIRDQVVLGLRDKKVQERVLREDDPNLDQVLTIVRAAEVAEQQSSKLTHGDSKSLEIDTGASCNVMSEKDYIRVTGDKSKVKLLPLDMQLSSYGVRLETTW